MNCRICTIALGLLPLALSLGCEKQPSAEEIKAQAIAEYEAQRAAEERANKLEQELADLKEQVADSEAARKQKDELQQALEKQVQDANRKAEEARKLAAAAKAVEDGKKVASAPQPAAAAPGGATTDGSRGSGRGDRSQAMPRTITVPRGTKLTVMLSEELSTEKQKANDAWTGSLANDVTIANEVVWKAGSPVRGIVNQSASVGRLTNGDGALAIRLTEINGADLDGGIFLAQIDSQGKRTAKVVGTTAALGAIIGALSNKSHQTDHALGGAAIGAALGTAVAAGTSSKEIKIKTGEPIEFTVPGDVRVTVRQSRGQQR